MASRIGVDPFATASAVNEPLISSPNSDGDGIEALLEDLGADLVSSVPCRSSAFSLPTEPYGHYQTNHHNEDLEIEAAIQACGLDDCPSPQGGPTLYREPQYRPVTPLQGSCGQRVAVNLMMAVFSHLPARNIGRSCSVNRAWAQAGIDFMVGFSGLQVEIMEELTRAAEASLIKVGVQDMQMLALLTDPPSSISMVLDCVGLLQREPWLEEEVQDRRMNPDGSEFNGPPTIQAAFEFCGREMLSSEGGRPNLLARLMDFQVDGITRETLELMSPYLETGELTFGPMAEAVGAAAFILHWVVSMAHCYQFKTAGMQSVTPTELMLLQTLTRRIDIEAIAAKGPWLAPRMHTSLEVISWYWQKMRFLSSRIPPSS